MLNEYMSKLNISVEPEEYDIIEKKSGKTLIKGKLHRLCREGKENAIIELIDEGIDLFSHFSYGIGVFGYTPLHETCVKGHSAVLSLLLNAKADPNIQCVNKHTPLHIAITHKHYSCVKVLLSFGAKIDIKDSYGRTPLELAIEKKFSGIIQSLMGRYLRDACSTNDTDKVNDVLKKVSEYKPNPISLVDYQESLIISVKMKNLIHIRKILLFASIRNYVELIELAYTIQNFEIVIYLSLCQAASLNDIETVKMIVYRKEKVYNLQISILKKALEKANNESIDKIIPMLIAKQRNNEACFLELLMNIDCSPYKRVVYWDSLNLKEITNNLLEKIDWVEKLHLGNNLLSFISDNIVNCRNLVLLNLSKNNLEYISPAVLSSIQSLEELDLSNNYLTTLPSITAPSTLRILNLSKNKIISLPENLNISKIQKLDLSSNKLTRIPYCVTNMVTLQALDISFNERIYSLPISLGKLEQLFILLLDGLPELNTGEFPTEAFDPNTNLLVSSVLIQHFKHKYQNSQEFNKIKLFIVGKQNRGKSTLVRRLKDNKTQTNLSTVGIVMSEWTYPPLYKGINKKSITFIVWDFGGQEEYYAAHQCFLSESSLYLLVWNINHGLKGIDELAPWLDNIQARTPHSTIIIVATHLDLVEDVSEVNNILAVLGEFLIRYRLLKIKGIMSVSCHPKYMSYINQLKDIIYATALELREHGKKQEDNIFGAKIPKYYIAFDRKIETLNKDLRKMKKSPILTFSEFEKLVTVDWEMTDLVCKNELKKAINFFHKAGKILYYDDPNSGLNDLIFVNPQWLCNMMANIITIKTKNPFINHGLMNTKHLNSLFKGQDEFPSDYFLNYLQLLEKFEIGLNIGQNLLLIPSMLPIERPEDRIIKSIINNHFYCRIILGVDLVPYGFWSRFHARLLHLVPQLQTHIQSINEFISNTKDVESWYNIDELAAYTSPEEENPLANLLTNSQSSNISLNISILKIWRQGILYQDDSFSFLVESLKYSSIIECPGKEGIIIICSKSNFGCETLGLTIDIVLSLCKAWYPGTCIEQFIVDERTINRKTLITNIYDDLLSINDCLDALSSNLNVIFGEYLYNLRELAPDLLLLDLPYQFNLRAENFEFNWAKTLGNGGFGSVFVGKYNEKSVAIKTYHQIDNDPISKLEALYELRQEAMVLKSLCHPCLISFVGVLIKPLSLVLEIALYGSLSERIKASKSKNELLFQRIVYFLIAGQIASGLKFLHTRSNPIIFRDLKPSNVLVVSTNPTDLIQVKLTDFGIAAYLQPSGSIGLEGTRGFQAPEILRYAGKVFYDHKVDIFSYAMLLFNLVSKELPFETVSSSFKIDGFIIEGTRPNLKSISILKFGMPIFDPLIHQCWSNNPAERPTTDCILDMLMNNTNQLLIHTKQIPSNKQVITISSNKRIICSTFLITYKNCEIRNEIEVYDRCTLKTTISWTIKNNFFQVKQAIIIEDFFWIILKSDETDNFCISIWKLDGNSYSFYLHEMIPISFDGLTAVVDDEKYLYMATNKNFILRYSCDTASLLAKDIKLHVIYLNDNKINTMIIINNQLWITSQEFLKIYDDFVLSESIQLSINTDSKILFKDMVLANNRNDLWLTRPYSTLLSIISTDLKKWILDLDVCNYKKHIKSNDTHSSEFIIVDICAELDVVWIGLTNGIILIISATRKTYLSYIIGYNKLLIMVSMQRNDRPLQEKAMIISYGINWNLDFFRSIKSNSCEKEFQLNGLMLWEILDEDKTKIIQARNSKRDFC